MPRLFITSLLTLFAVTSVYAEDQIVKINDAIISGQIISEDDEAVVLLIRGIELRIPKSEIRDIIRDEESAPAAAGSSTPSSSVPMIEMSEPEEVNKWARRVDSNGDLIPLVAVIPVGYEGREQVGTDIVPETYQAMIPELKRMNPDYIVFKVECNDRREDSYWYGTVKETEKSLDTDFDLLGEIARVWHVEFQAEGIDATPICWVNQAVGSSAVLSLSFCNLYTTFDAAIGGLQGSSMMFERVRDDENTYGKYREAFLGMFRGPLELGREVCEGEGHDNMLLDALVYGDMMLSATWEGRSVKWSLDRSGSYVVDASDKAAVEFTAKQAGDFLISKGMTDDLEDLMLLHGIVDFDADEVTGKELYDEYCDTWRRLFNDCEEAVIDMQGLQAGLGPSEEMQQLNYQLTRWKKILRLMQRSTSVAIRCQLELRISIPAAKLQIAQLEEQIRSLRNADRGGRQGGRGAPRGGGRGIGGR